MKTGRKKYTKKCKEMHRRIKGMMTWKLTDIIKRVNQILAGYFHYYGITDNINSIGRFRYEVEKSLFYWLNHRSQKRSYTWEEFREMQKVYPLEPAKFMSVSMTVEEQLTLQRAECGKAARSVS